MIFYVLQLLCNLSFAFFLLDEFIMIKGCNIQFDLFVFETWFLILTKKILRALNNSVMRKLRPNRDELMERCMK